MRRPNILILYTDQQRWDALGANGNPEIQTPNLDRLAASGVNFNHAFVQNPVCMPSRVSFLTGQYPSTLGITHMGVPVPPETVTLPGMLRSYGYRTANIGKLHFLPHANRDHRLPHPSYGFDHLEISDEPGPYEDAYRAWVRHRAPEALHAISVGLPPNAALWGQTMGIAETVVHPEDRFPKRAIPFGTDDGLTHTAFVAEQTMAFIAQQRRQPWFCVAGWYSPHSPWVVPQRFLDQYDPASLMISPPEARISPFAATGNADSENAAGKDDELLSATHGYYAMVSEVDHHVGRLLDHLDALDLTDDTIIVFTSDHGEWLGKYGRYGKGHPADDAVSRVPLIMRWPGGHTRPNRASDAIVEAVDVAPTLLEGAGIQIPPTLQGRSLAPILTGVEPDAGDGRDAALTEHRGWKSLRTREYRYLIASDGREHLFDLAADPLELRDVADKSQSAAALASLRHQMLQRILSAERPRERTWTY